MINTVDLRTTINAFFSAVDENVDDKGSVQALIRALDLLAYQTHTMEIDTDDAYFPGLEPPKQDYQERYQRIGKQFSQLGYYNIADSISENISDTSICVGDAIDDIVDIYQELNDVIWYLEYSSETDANFYFVWSYRVHWCRHLRELQLYLFKFTEQLRNDSL